MFIVFNEHDVYTGNINHLVNELAFRRVCLCASRLAYITNGGSGGVMSTAGLELPYETSPRGQSSNVCDRSCVWRTLWVYRQHKSPLVLR